MLQQMKNTVESSLQELVEKTQERQANQPPTPLPPVTVPPPNLSPRRRRSPRRPRRSSRPRSSSRDVSTQRQESRLPGRGQSITLRSASPRHREERHRTQDHQQSHQTTTLQAAPWGHNPQPTTYTDPQTRSYHHEHSSTDKWQSGDSGRTIPNTQPHPPHPIHPSG